MNRHVVRVPGAETHIAKPAGSGKSERHHQALHSPLSALMLVGLARYREAIGDVITRLVVVRYRDVLEGAPLWHVVVQFAVSEGAMRMRSEWSRRDRRRAAQIAEGLLAHHGEGEIIDGATIEGLNAEIGLHRLRRVTREEMACFPDGYLEKPSLLLQEEDEDVGRDREGAIREAAGDSVLLQMGLGVAGETSGAAGGAADPVAP